MSGSGSSVATYATLDRVLALFDTPPLERVTARLTTALAAATDELIEELNGRDFFRHPATSDDTFPLTDVDGPILHVHAGIVSITTLELRSGDTYRTLSASDYVLHGDAPSNPVSYREPAFHIELVRGIWRDGARLTGVMGWPSIPSALAEGCAARARQLTFGDASYEGSIISDPSLGHPMVSGRWPDVTYRFIARERQRFVACLFAPAHRARPLGVFVP